MNTTNNTQLQNIGDIAQTLGLTPEECITYGPHIAKINYQAIQRCEDRKPGKLILVSAITPTPAGEGKTTTSIGLVQGLRHAGVKAVAALREPSLGPVFGMKGGATGGGMSKIHPENEINLHFTGDIHAVSSAHNLISAAIDNAIHFNLPGAPAPTKVSWPRVMDMNDRALRSIVTGMDQGNGPVRQSGFDITAASEIMAILCLSRNYADLKERIGRISIGTGSDGERKFVSDIGVQNAAAALLRDALLPNLVQTTEGAPVLVHGGPFANIAQGANSILATRLAMRLSDVTVTEAGFGFDLGGEKFFDIVAPNGGFMPDLLVLVATVRALKHHAGTPADRLDTPNPAAVRGGSENLVAHIQNAGKFGCRVIVAINAFPADSQEELEAVQNICREQGAEAHISRHFSDGGKGALELAEACIQTLKEDVGQPATSLYSMETTCREKIETVAKNIYGADGVDFTNEAERDMKRIARDGYGALPVCIAKTQSSLSDTPGVTGRPSGFRVTIRGVLVNSGAGFLVPLAGAMMRMPGLPKHPAALDISISDDGEIQGIN